MSKYGEGAKATTAERAEVVRLREDGWSIRRIAAEVFGDVRYRGRVERILHHRQDPPPRFAEQEERLDLTGLLDTTALLRVLQGRRLARWGASDEAPSMNELRNLVRVERDLLAMEEHQRLTERHRARRQSAPGDQPLTEPGRQPAATPQPEPDDGGEPLSTADRIALNRLRAMLLKARRAGDRRASLAVIAGCLSELSVLLPAQPAPAPEQARQE
jgi:hypothetical protein